MSPSGSAELQPTAFLDARAGWFHACDLNAPHFKTAISMGKYVVSPATPDRLRPLLRLLLYPSFPGQRQLLPRVPF